jgi:hypothetical protein
VSAPKFTVEVNLAHGYSTPDDVADVLESLATMLRGMPGGPFNVPSSGIMLRDEPSPDWQSGTWAVRNDEAGVAPVPTIPGPETVTGQRVRALAGFLQSLAGADAEHADLYLADAAEIVTVEYRHLMPGFERADVDPGGKL